MIISRRAFTAAAAAVLVAPSARGFAQVSSGKSSVEQFGSDADLRALGVFNVRHYGAQGDGTTDDTASIQSAIDAAFMAHGGFVYLPNGRYNVATSHHLVARVSTCLELKPGVILRGQSRDGTIIRLANGVQACVVAGGPRAHGCGVMLLTLDGNREHQINSNQDGNQCGLFTYQSERTLILAASFINAKRQGYYDSENTFTRVDDIYAENCGSEGFSLSSSHYGKYDNIVVRRCGQTGNQKNPYASGVFINGGAIENTVTNVYSGSNVGYGISFASVRGTTGCVNNTLIGFSSERNLRGGVCVGTSVGDTFVSRNKFIGLASRLNGTPSSNEADISLIQANDNIFVGCTEYNAKGQGPGLYMVKSQNNRFDGFETYDDQPTITRSYGILEGGDCSGNVFNNPIFRGGFLSGAYSLRTTAIRGAVGARDRQP